MGEIPKNKKRNERIRQLMQIGYEAKEIVKEIKKDIEAGLLPPRTRISVWIVYKKA